MDLDKNHVPNLTEKTNLIADSRFYSYYAYDHGGERRLKLKGTNNVVDVNADHMSTHSVLDSPTLYPSAYMVVTSKGYTKHYYAGAERVAARIGGGWSDGPVPLAGKDDSLSARADLLYTQSLGQTNGRVLEENEPGCFYGPLVESEGLNATIEGIPNHLQAVAEADCGTFLEAMHQLVEGGPGGPENDVYFYHSDHLGSASWITDSAGQAIQHLQYLPFGEPYVNQRTSNYSERFTFTGKERDEETGYGYFGARYMDHELMAMWLSVDPMADKYPSISPYAYCAWNPVKLVDPDGKMWKDSTDAKVATEIRSSVMQRISDIESSINSCQQKIDKRRAKGKNVDKQLFQLSELQNQKLLLEDFVIGIDQLEQSEDVVFTFNPTRGDYHEVSLCMSDEYSINYQSGNDGNLVHETTHAIQLYRINFCSAKSMSPNEMEMNAYSTQYSFMPSSVSVLYNDSGISPSSKIPLAWVKGLYLIRNGKKFYPYDENR